MKTKWRRAPGLRARWRRGFFSCAGVFDPGVRAKRATARRLCDYFPAAKPCVGAPHPRLLTNPFCGVRLRYVPICS
jgi:hypothetical protein